MIYFAEELEKQRRSGVLMIWIFISCREPMIKDTSIMEEEESHGWYSQLYPEDWNPEYTDTQGLFLHDFSYAGYHNGEKEPPTVDDFSRYSVLNYGADPQGQNDSTAAFHSAIEAAIGGGIVWVPEGLYRIDGVLRIEHSNIVLAGEGSDKSRLRFTKDTSMTDQSSIIFSGTVIQGMEEMIVQDISSRSKEAYIENPEALREGQDVALGWVITDDFVEEHGMSDYWSVFNGQWVPFFRRTIENVDEDNVSFDVPSRYRAMLRDLASIRIEEGYISECGIQDLSVANAIEFLQALQFDRVHAIQFEGVKDCWMKNVHSFAPPEHTHHLQSGGVKILSSKRVTVADSRMEQAQHRGGGGNGYLFEVSQSSEILIRDSIGIAGRHNFIQNWGFGTTGCVFLRTESRDGTAYIDETGELSSVGYSEFHHSLAMANLIDSSTADDGWKAVNRLFYSSGSGHSATENVFWNIKGEGSLYSYQYGYGYVIGSTNIDVYTEVSNVYDSFGTAPEDFSEGIEEGSTLIPQSLYEDQLRRRLSRQ